MENEELMEEETLEELVGDRLEEEEETFSGKQSRKGEYGKILYQDSNAFKQRRDQSQELWLNIFRFIAACFFIGCIVMLTNDLFASFVLGLFSAWFFVTGYGLSYRPEYEFIIYENGIRFSSARIYFIIFSDIDHIEEIVGFKWVKPFLSIHTKSGWTFYIASGRMKGAHESPEDYQRTKDVLFRRMREINEGRESTQIH